MIGVGVDFPFCSNPDCVLYVRTGDPGIKGSGNWAELSDGRILGRSIYSGVYLCDICGLNPETVVRIDFAAWTSA